MNTPSTISDDASIRLLIIASIYYAQIAHVDGDPDALAWIRSTGTQWLESIGMDGDKTISEWILNGCPSPGQLDIVAASRRHSRGIARDLEAKARTPQAAPASNLLYP